MRLEKVFKTTSSNGQRALTMDWTWLQKKPPLSWSWPELALMQVDCSRMQQLNVGQGKDSPSQPASDADSDRFTSNFSTQCF